jgi:8-amino-7-oxononanoate synthase
MNVDRIRDAHPSPIIPFVIGDERATLAAARALLDRNLLVPAIRPPTVAVGTSRLRVTVSAAHTDAEVDALLAALTDVLGVARR